MPAIMGWTSGGMLFWGTHLRGLDVLGLENPSETTVIKENNNKVLTKFMDQYPRVNEHRHVLLYFIIDLRTTAKWFQYDLRFKGEGWFHCDISIILAIQHKQKTVFMVRRWQKASRVILWTPSMCIGSINHLFGKWHDYGPDAESQDIVFFSRFHQMWGDNIGVRAVELCVS